MHVLQRASCRLSVSDNPDSRCRNAVLLLHAAQQVLSFFTALSSMSHQASSRGQCCWSPVDGLEQDGKEYSSVTLR